jgi:asparagine synthase (glutamine-hydrolysing)
MCGIAGIVSFDGAPVPLEDLRRMSAALVHRGPDDEGFYLGPSAGLAMRRLSIIDVETGRQPVRNEDATVWAVFNGEIYNFRELRHGLKGRGHVFYTGTDTEVIVHLYEEHGPRCVEHLRGMFAFAVWDERRQALLLARDRVGIKPLYYAEAGGRLSFGSELKAILQLAEVERVLNWTALGHLFAFLTTPRAESIVRGVYKLEPGTILTASAAQGVQLHRYWDLEWTPDYSRGEAALAEELRGRLEESVRLHLVSDVPLGAFLSGGVDSSSVVATMARLSPQPVKTFSIGFAEDDYNELGYARTVARAFGTEHRELVLKPDVLSVVEELAWYLDEPFGDPSAIPTYMVSKLASEHVTVALSGDGGDELFGGYDRYRVEARERRLERLPRAVRRMLGAVAGKAPETMKGRNFLRHLAFDGFARYLDACTYFRLEEQKALFQPDIFEIVSTGDPWRDAASGLVGRNGHWLSSVQHLDLNGYLPLDILTKVDRMSMAHSLEARVPLLDHKLIEFAATIPPELKLHRGTTKYIFKSALRGILPDAIIDRPKQGFAIPLGRWFRGRLGEFVRELLLSVRARQRGLFESAYLEKLLERHKRGRDLDAQLWTLISFELWARRFLDEAWRPVAVPDDRAPFVVGPAAHSAAGEGAGRRQAPGTATHLTQNTV